MEEKKIRRKNNCINPDAGLEAAILKVARLDYEYALERQKAAQDPKEAKREIKLLEKFFLSEWGQLLSDHHGELIIEKCRKNVYGGMVI